MCLSNYHLFYITATYMPVSAISVVCRGTIHYNLFAIQVTNVVCASTLSTILDLRYSLYTRRVVNNSFWMRPVYLLLLYVWLRVSFDWVERPWWFLLCYVFIFRNWFYKIDYNFLSSITAYLYIQFRWFFFVEYGILCRLRIS